MTKNKAMWEVTHLSSGTIATITGKTKYEQIDAVLCDWIKAISDASEDAFQNCENWNDVLDVIQGKKEANPMTNEAIRKRTA